MRTTLRRNAITGILFFGVVFTSNTFAQEANEPAQLRDDIESGEDDALSTGGDDLNDLINSTEKSVKNEFQKDVALVESVISTPTPSVLPTTLATATPDDSLKEIEREVDSLEAQSRQLSQ